MGLATRQLRLFLIRHGETVDNIAQVYAGSRDSKLTNHGYQQATRLGLHFKTLGLKFTHIFSSHLQRAAKTASLIRDGQASDVGVGVANDAPHVVQLPILMEQDFGFYEGKRWHERSASHDHKDTPGFVDVESKEAMAKRADKFLDEHLVPLFHGPEDTSEEVIAVVSHGIMLSTLWKRLLLRLPPKSVKVSPALFANAREYSLEHLGGWSNTGYLELQAERPVAPPAVPAQVPAQSAGNDVASPPILESAPAEVVEGHVKIGLDPQTISDVPKSDAGQPQKPLTVPVGWTTYIETVNGRDHLQGLKRTRGGVGSAGHDSSQKNLDSFFKKRKVDG
ncbi:phosphoglycerate mutase-like protein [Lophiostoma macrostomum CBS 122681]|uniref:Phosphoglycerate mutase-like protein n=1 Tax=Lophiostoma macrostomum CBS 122681 TaxID=1314788 RepID=A0A6A6TAI8_9PLEO|nr:phosphoglycerate mutase-like protein [Lophiostoma macrostomum CBS 122681]